MRMACSSPYTPLLISPPSDTYVASRGALQVRAQGMELAVPGTYIAGEPLVTIAAFAPQLQVISSKQRPRKLTIHGGDGAEYMFLLKGHEVGLAVSWLCYITRSSNH
jgi:hypothetical protein